MMNLIGQRTTPDGLARLARPWQATLALALALLPAAGTATAQDTTSPPLKSAKLLGTELTLTFDKPVVIGPTALLVHGFTVDGILNSGSVQPSAMDMDNRTATLELGMVAEPGQTVTVSYDPDKVPNTPPTALYPKGRHFPLRYTDGTLVPAFTGAPVTILAPKPATDLTFSNEVGTTIDLSWTLPTQPEGVVVTSVEVHGVFTKRGRAADFTSYGTARLAADATSITWPVFHGGVFIHYFRVRLYTDHHHVDSDIASWTSDQEGLKRPTGVTASNTTQTTVDLAWTLPEQAAWVKQAAAADEARIRIREWEADGTYGTTLATLAPDAVAHTVTGLNAGTAYNFRVELSAGSQFAASKPVSVTTLDESAPLTAAFHEVPAWHGGEGREFSFELRFSENFPGRLPYKKLRDEALSATNGRVTGAKRVAQGQNQRWTITVRPHSSEDVIVTLAATTDCGASDAICTPDGRPLSNSPSATVVGPSNRTPLTAAFHDVPAAHGGKDADFSFELRFSENFPGRLPYKKLRDEALSATNGKVTRARRAAPNQNQRWIITVRPRSSENVVVTLAATTDCSAAAAICTPDGRPLSNSPSATIEGPSAGHVANSDVADDSLALADAALAVADGLSPDEAAAALFGERTLSEVRQSALDRLGNRNGSYDLGDLLSWIERCRRREARCEGTPADPGPSSGAALVGAATAGRRGNSRRRGRSRVRGMRRRAGKAGWALAMLLAAVTAWSCTGDSVAPTAPVAAVPNPGFLTIEFTPPPGHRDIGVLLRLKGPGIDNVRASGLELYQSEASGPRQMIVAGALSAGSLVRFEVPDRGQLPLYRVHVLEVTGEDYGLRDAAEYRAVVTR
ncbi:MAG: SwmB domain-containing protein [Gemmatimonadota bacterium]|nr:SwmB domain-containing protein [Gemmatimonadota bacterium]